MPGMVVTPERRAYVPYAVQMDHQGRRYFYLNRDYKLLGTDVTTAGFQAYPFRGGQREYLFGDANPPWLSVAAAEAYRSKLCIIIEGMQRSVYTLVGADVNPADVGKQ